MCGETARLKSVRGLYEDFSVTDHPPKRIQLARDAKSHSVYEWHYEIVRTTRPPFADYTDGTAATIPDQLFVIPSRSVRGAVSEFCQTGNRWCDGTEKSRVSVSVFPIGTSTFALGMFQDKKA